MKMFAWKACDEAKGEREVGCAMAMGGEGGEEVHGFECERWWPQLFVREQ